MSIVTWNTADFQAPMTFSNGDLDASESTTDRVGVRSTISRSTGKYYLEFEVINTDLPSGGSDMYVGFNSADADLNDNGANTTEYPTRWRGSGSIRDQVNGSPTAYVLSDVLQCAIDLDAKKLWLARTTNNWIGGGDPALGTLPTVSYAFGGTDLFAYFVSDNITALEQKMRILGNASNQHNAAPSGFLPFGDEPAAGLMGQEVM